MAEEVEEGRTLRYLSSPNFSTKTVFSSHAMPSLRDPSLSHIRQETVGCHGGKSTYVHKHFLKSALLFCWLDLKGGGWCFSNVQNPFITYSSGSQTLASIGTTWRAHSNMDFWGCTQPPPAAFLTKSVWGRAPKIVFFFKQVPS